MGRPRRMLACTLLAALPAGAGCGSGPTADNSRIQSPDDKALGPPKSPALAPGSKLKLDRTK